MVKHTQVAEKALFHQAQAGDRRSMATLMRRHENLVHAVVRKQWSGDWRYADIVHAGRIGLWRAILKYDPEYGTRFSTYAWPAIAHQVWATVKPAQPRTAVNLRETSLGQAPDVAQQVQRAQVHRALHQAVSRLPDKEQWIVARYYGLDGRGGCTQTVLGQVLGCTRQAVGYHLQKALRRLRHPGWSARLRALLGYNDRDAYHAAVVSQRDGAR